MLRPSDLVTSRELLLNLTLRELRGKYKRSALGWAWSMLNPLATVAIFSLVFKFFLKIQVPAGDPSGLKGFALWLLCGLLTWNLFSNSLNGAMGSLVTNSSLVRKVYFPREALPLSNIASNVVSSLIEFGVLAAILLIAGNMIVPWIPLLLGLIVVGLPFVVGLSLMLSVLNVYFRDVQYLTGIVLQALFYATPIVYPITLVPERHEVLGRDVPILQLYRLNPLVRLVEAVRDVFYDLRVPPIGDIVYILGVGLVVLAGGLAVFSRFEGRLAEEL
jgi:ABC-type polysaccharide/polyol phosphate export permease